MNPLLIVLKASCIMGAAAMVSAPGYRRSSAVVQASGVDARRRRPPGVCRSCRPVCRAGRSRCRPPSPRTQPSSSGPHISEIASPTTVGAAAAETMNAPVAPASVAGGGAAGRLPRRRAPAPAPARSRAMAGSPARSTRRGRRGWRVDATAVRMRQGDGRRFSRPPVAQPRAQHADGVRHRHALDPDSRRGRYVDRRSASRRSSPRAGAHRPPRLPDAADGIRRVRRLLVPPRRVVDCAPSSRGARAGLRRSSDQRRRAGARLRRTPAGTGLRARGLPGACARRQHGAPRAGRRTHACGARSGAQSGSAAPPRPHDGCGDCGRTARAAGRCPGRRRLCERRKRKGRRA